MKLMTTGFRDPGEADRDWPDQWPDIENRLRDHLDDWDGRDLSFTLKENYYPLGADFPAVAVSILKIGGLVVSIPAAHKLVRETIGEWKRIWANLLKLFEWIKRRERILSYSMEVAFYRALADLEGQVDVGGLSLVEAKEIPGCTDSPAPSFETAMILYYLFVFRSQDSRLIVVVYDSQLTLVSDALLPLHPEAHAREIGP